MSDNRFEYDDTPRPALLDLVPAGVKRVLDVGCYKGGFGSALKARMPVEVWGIEPNARAAEIARERIDHVIADFFGPDNPLPDGHFDLITFNDSLEHMADPWAALEVAKRKLAPGGRIHCCVPNMRHVECIEHLLFGKDWAYEDVGIRDRTHLRFFTPRSIVALFNEQGFRVHDTRLINEAWWEPGKRLRRMMFRLFPGLTEDMKFKQVVVVATPAAL
jgi:SAM-dependent methyltransferase